MGAEAAGNQNFPVSGLIRLTHDDGISGRIGKFFDAVYSRSEKRLLDFGDNDADGFGRWNPDDNPICWPAKPPAFLSWD